MIDLKSRYRYPNDKETFNNLVEGSFSFSYTATLKIYQKRQNPNHLIRVSQSINQPTLLWSQTSKKSKMKNI